MKKIVAIIPARGGPKNIPGKNTKDFCGKPLIAWSIEVAKKSKYVDRVILSTDSEEVRRIGVRHGAEAPFLRPSELATDTMGVEPVLKHAYEWLQEHQKYKADVLVLLMPTTPTRQAFHIDNAIDIILQTNADSVVAVNETPANHTPYWTLVRNKAGKVTLWGGADIKNIMTRRQDFPQKCYARNDLVYVLKPKNLYEEKPNLYGDRVEFYDVPDALRYESDINTPAEWAESEEKFKKLQQNHD